MSDLFPSDNSRNSLLSAQKLVAKRAVISDDFTHIKLIGGAAQVKNLLIPARQRRFHLKEGRSDGC
jgi:hypothetical protein